MAAPSLHDALRDLASDNPYADLSLDGPADPAPALSLAEAGEVLLSGLLRRECARIGTTEVRVAASLVQFGVAEKLWAIRLGLWARHDLLLPPDAIGVRSDTPRWRLTLMPGATATAAGPDEEGHGLASSVLDQLEVLHTDLRRHCRVADGVLWGNAATGLVCQTARHHRADPAGAGRRLVRVRDRLLGRGPLHGLVDGIEPAQGAPAYQRRSCCLYYRSALATACSDCPIATSAAARARAGATP